MITHVCFMRAPKRRGVDIVTPLLHTGIPLLWTLLGVEFDISPPNEMEVLQFCRAPAILKFGSLESVVPSLSTPLRHGWHALLAGAFRRPGRCRRPHLRVWCIAAMARGRRRPGFDWCRCHRTLHRCNVPHSFDPPVLPSTPTPITPTTLRRRPARVVECLRFAAPLAGGDGGVAHALPCSHPAQRRRERPDQAVCGRPVRPARNVARGCVRVGQGVDPAWVSSGAAWT